MLVPAMLVSLLSGLVIALSGVLVTAAAATGASADHRQPDSQQARANLSKQDLEFQKNRIKDMFYHAYDSYIRNAYPYDELRPITCTGFDTWGSYSLTLIDSLDMLIILANRTEFERVVKLLEKNLNFNKDINVSTFETNIRIIGGLLSAHLLSYRLYVTQDEDVLDAAKYLHPEWPCDGPLLRIAVDVANRILPAFNTATGMPYGTVNLVKGVPKSETPETCVAGVGTFLLEFATLSRLTGDPTYENVAQRALNSLWELRSSLNLVGNHLNVESGKWTSVDATIGSGVDSYFEYLLKGGMLLDKPELVAQFRTYQRSIQRFLTNSDDAWFFWANMHKGQKTLPLFSSLEAFYPGLLALAGDIEQASHIVRNYHQIWRKYGSLPEFYNIMTHEVHNNREAYPLRPELIESLMYVARANDNDMQYMEMAVDYVDAIERVSRLPCGFATVKSVKDHALENRMESFFLAETLKYLYLIFDTDSFLHNRISSSGGGQVVRNARGSCRVETGFFFFNTEAHPLDGAAIECCRVQRLADKNKEGREDEYASLLRELNVESLIERYVSLSSPSPSSSSRNSNIRKQSSDDEALSLMMDENAMSVAKSQTRLHRYCEHAANGETLVNLINDPSEVVAWGHNYPSTCSLNDTFRVFASNLNSFSFYP